MNPYRDFASSFAKLVEVGKSLPLGGIPQRGRAKSPGNASLVLIFSPHPDDECLVGGLALRLMREAEMRVVNVAVTQGSRPVRQRPRWQELKNACGWLGFELEQTTPNGLGKVSLENRTNHSERWCNGVKVIARILARHRPRAIFFPHDLDWNSTHIGTHFLVIDMLKVLPSNFQCAVIETEYWASLSPPNLMVELSVGDVANLLAALSCHVGEVKRNPFHLRMPAWLQDNVRRGAELVGGQGGMALDFAFAMLYRLHQWKRGRVENLFEGGKQIRAAENPAEIILLMR